MGINRIRISNDKLWDISQRGESIDTWLIDNVGYGNWTEWIAISMVPYRSFSFNDPKYETMFILKWG